MTRSISSNGLLKRLAFPEPVLRRFRGLFTELIQRRGPTRPPMMIGYRQIFILPTRFGWAMGVLLSAMLVGSLNFNNNLGLFTTFLVAGIGLLAMHAAHRNLDGLKIQSTSARPVFAGDPLELAIAVREEIGRRRSGLVAECGEAPQPSNGADIASYATEAVVLQLPTRRRGWMELPRIRLRTRFPIGWFEAWTWFWPEQRARIWPRPAVEAPPLSASGSNDSPQQAGDESDEFHGLRDWREGDPLHRIAWKASQRHQNLLARQFTRPAREQIVLRLTDAPAADHEGRIAVVARWVLEAEHRGLVYALDLGTIVIPAGCGVEHRNRCLDALADLP